MALNTAFGGFRGSTKVPVDLLLSEVEAIDALMGYDNRWKHYTEIPVIKLEDATSYMEDPYLIKLDCEGCEYEVPRSSLDSLKRFRAILLEYLEYYKGYEIIVEKLRDLYKCSHIDHRFLEHSEKQGVMICARS